MLHATPSCMPVAGPYVTGLTVLTKHTVNGPIFVKYLLSFGNERPHHLHAEFNKYIY